MQIVAINVATFMCEYLAYSILGLKVTRTGAFMTFFIRLAGNEHFSDSSSKAAMLFYFS